MCVCDCIGVFRVFGCAVAASVFLCVCVFLVCVWLRRSCLCKCLCVSGLWLRRSCLCKCVRVCVFVRCVSGVCVYICLVCICVPFLPLLVGVGVWCVCMCVWNVCVCVCVCVRCMYIGCVAAPFLPL